MSDRRPDQVPETAMLLQIVQVLREEQKYETAARRIDEIERHFVSAASPSKRRTLRRSAARMAFVAATDKELQLSEKRFLKRVGKAIGRQVELPRVEQICSHLEDGDEPPDFLRCASS